MRIVLKKFLQVHLVFFSNRVIEFIKSEEEKKTTAGFITFSHIHLLISLLKDTIGFQCFKNTKSPLQRALFCLDQSSFFYSYSSFN